MTATVTVCPAESSPSELAALIVSVTVELSTWSLGRVGAVNVILDPLGGSCLMVRSAAQGHHAERR